MSIGEKIRQYREQKGWTVTRLAEEAGVSKPYISQLENDPGKKVSADILFKIANALGTSMAVLMNKEIPFAKQAEIPDSLRIFADKHGLIPEEVTMLAGIQYRGKRPTTERDWEFIYNTIKIATKGDD